jgi:hypothetical protein
MGVNAALFPGSSVSEQMLCNASAQTVIFYAWLTIVWVQKILYLAFMVCIDFVGEWRASLNAL